MNDKVVGINCVVKKPLEIRISDQKDNVSSGVVVIDITLQSVQYFDLGSIAFRNNYTAFLLVKVKCKPPNEKDEAQWRDCVKQLRLMPDPHTETDSQAYFTITRSQMLFEPTEVTAVRLVLLQPSPVWAHFGIEEVTVLPPETKSERSTSVTAWLLENQHLTDSSPKQASKKQAEDSPPVDKITAGLQHLWALTETMRSNQTQTSLGRYDVDGSYEINLLSYT
ncbi:nicolin-1-like [Patiria miniata]|uniref:Nicolin-1 n=1 Tax=Patiria miniata TaxID=46514 RepID=A0A914AVV2_PATMI|nr:nicolin-1-like [Patiria miniata]XP_038067887.1 nicolin-1-like [Patiria miniata]